MKTPKPEITQAELDAAEQVALEATATLKRLMGQKGRNDLTAPELDEGRRAARAISAYARLYARAVTQAKKPAG